MGSGFRTFASGETLTSSNVQNFLMDQSVMVFAGTAARGSAIASPESGMVTYRTDGTADSKREGFEFYDGASWTRLIPAAATSGLELISSTTIGSAVASVTVSGAFSATYDAYKITVTGGASSANANMQMQLGASTASYFDVVLYVAASTVTVPQSAGTNNGAAFARIGSSDTDGIQVDIDVINPFLSKQTSFFGLYTFGSLAYGLVSGFHNATTSHTAFTISPSTGTLTGGTIRVYGYKN